MRELSHSLSRFVISGHRTDHRQPWLRHRRPPYTVVRNKKGCVRSQRRRKFLLWCKVRDGPWDEEQVRRPRMSGAHGSL
ncbi:hypothetical protein V6Z11_A09G216000 [Gossypium hirsutum]